MGRSELSVAVAYVTLEVQDVTELTLPAGATVRDAIERSAVLVRHPQLTNSRLDVGVWGRAVTAEHRLSDGDRVEIYRPLTVEPKEARRVRAAVRRRRRGA